MVQYYSLFASIVVVVGLLNLVPVFVELMFNVLERFGFRAHLRWRHFRRFNKVLLILSCVSVASLILVAAWMHHIYYMDFFTPLSLFEWIVLHYGPSLWLNANMLVNFYRASVLDPGYVRTSPLVTSKLYPKRCERCNLPKPLRAHHCSTCGQCVLRMDHHCPFTHSCVGFNNYRYFFLFIFYATLSSMYAVYVAVRPFHLCIWDRDSITPSQELLCKEHGSEDSLTVVFLLSVFIMIVLVLFFAFLLLLLLKGQSTNEFLNEYLWGGPTDKRLQHRLNRPASSKLLTQSYSLGGWRQHVQQLFGPVTQWYRWIVPTPVVGGRWDGRAFVHTDLDWEKLVEAKNANA